MKRIANWLYKKFVSDKMDNHDGPYWMNAETGELVPDVLGCVVTSICNLIWYGWLSVRYVR